MLTRRIFLRGSAVVMAGMGAAPPGLPGQPPPKAGRTKPWWRFSCAAPPTDSTSLCRSATSATANCGRRSPSRRPAGQDNGNGGPFGPAIDLDGTFALNGALQPLKALWDKQQLAIVEATGSPDPSRSHFDAQDYMESGTPGKSAANGWLNRALPAAKPRRLAVARRRAWESGTAHASRRARSDRRRQRPAIQASGTRKRHRFCGTCTR